ncbi:conserved hypothetical protein [Candidatus Desulfovibrio trichonymphae]|uniref:Nucleoside transporter/FeoB GTPase Gate domain-containing protein n=1 Tax=Candidatus Desulfovibrio trichonymphae TaxID=1725232 RepID=A0A1J1DQY2_9BACT|nr:conserved hypothetical protein [Candidatus Desulfovibrio trichonymphae]
MLPVFSEVCKIISFHFSPDVFSAVELWHSLGVPLLRLLTGLAAGLLVANLLEALHWTRHIARLAAPLSRAAHLRETAGAAFALAFVSPVAANGLLSEKYNAGLISGRELMLANLFNSLPAYLVHTPTIFLLIWPVLGPPAALYVGLTLLAAAGRTCFTVLLGRLLLQPVPVRPQTAFPADTPFASVQRDIENVKLLCRDFAASPCLKIVAGRIRSIVKRQSQACFAPGDALRRACRRFAQRLPKLFGFTAPAYVLMYALQHCGVFHSAELWITDNMAWLSFLKPQVMGIIALHLAAELGAALGAAGSALQAGGVYPRDIVLALMVGNILSTPMRALCHQLPSYTGFFRPGLALRLVLANQGLRAVSMTLMTVLYYCCS